jgi:HAD superfamily hydrolase (TIGR01490 family)
MTLVLFDLDNTLIGGDSDYLWGEFLVRKELVDVEAYRQSNEAFYRDYETGRLDVAAYLKFALAPLATLEPQFLTELHAEFMQQCIEPIWLPKAEKLVSLHRDAGQELAVITSTNRFVVEPIVAKLEIENLICSEPEIIDGRYSGNFIGTPCFAEGKITNINQWLKDRRELLKSAWFYSDSHNDLPLMREVDTPVAVDPDDKLLAEAQALDWKIISLR